jgi:hypothetical protein
MPPVNLMVLVYTYAAGMHILCGSFMKGSKKIFINSCLGVISNKWLFVYYSHFSDTTISRWGSCMVTFLWDKLKGGTSMAGRGGTTGQTKRRDEPTGP